ncbi:cysteine--tRNA ligase [Actinomyces minihominis]|uniref:cysteine--tRNA ligase n=1 Tax=Actinomyces minihominis TaxID=2002838 RepID=UPI000C06E01B|nr:cysteine--tRNA ligase [Actinomyces minihominis]
MDLRLYDTKTATLQNLVPIQDGRVGIYLCGPTVQGMPHIGHLRAATSFDVLIRWLQRYGLDVTYVRNVTDIDDKILSKSAESGEEWWALATRYEREFQKAYATLGLVEPTVEPRATGHITDQIAFIERLIQRGHAYSDETGNVYFDVHSQPDYGSLTHQSLDQMRTTEGEAETEAILAGKRDTRDFALWKATKPEEPQTASWEAPWGRGRPGWHLECSAMSHRYLGEAFDIHGGGIDLRFPHHENEQAQSHAAGYDFANLWVHNAWVTIAGDKMSKSVGNTLDLQSLLQQAPAAVIRFALSSVHHRSMIEWSETTLELAGKSWDKVSSFVAEAAALVGDPASIFMTPEELPAQFTAALNDDLNVAAGLAVVYEHVKTGRRAMAEGDLEAVAVELKTVRSMLDVLGVDPGSQQWAQVEAGPGGKVELLESALGVMIDEVLAERATARAEKNWTRADELRDRLAGAGILVEDGPGGATWQVAPKNQ